MITPRTILVAAWLAMTPGQARAADPPKPAAAPAAPVFTVNDNTIGYYYAFTATNPGAGPSPKHVVAFTHFDVWTYGANFVNVEWLKATNAQAPPFGAPAAPCDQGGPLDPPGSTRCSGYTEIYGFFRSIFGWNQIFDTKAFAVGPLTNIEFAVGADANTDNTTLASAKRAIQAGLQFDFAAPYGGFLNVGVFVYKEWQHNGFAVTFPVQPIPNPGGRVDFDPTWAVEITYSQPLGFLPPAVPLTYKAVAVLHGSKGCGEPCAPLGPGLRRINEYLTQQSLTLDLGKMLWDRPKRLSIWAGYRWWKNKFGIAPNQPSGPFVGTLESTWLAGAAVTF